MGRANGQTTVKLPEAIEHWPIDRLRPYDKNPRTHSRVQIRKIADSLREFGWTNPILVDGDSGIIAGHGRLEAAKLLGLAAVPVIELSHLTPAQRRAYILADNRLALDAGWDEDLLASELRALQDLDFDLPLTGFDGDELRKLLQFEDTVEVDTPERPENPVSRAGDLWHLGDHLVLCGDATDAGALERVLPVPAAMCFTDPPYDIGYGDRPGNAWRGTRGSQSRMTISGRSGSRSSKRSWAPFSAT